MFCRYCGTQMNETMPCPNCGWQRTAGAVIQPQVNEPINTQQEDQSRYTNADNNVNYQPEDNTEGNQVQFTPVNSEVNYQPQFTPVNNAVNYQPRKSSENTSQILIYIAGIFMKLVSYALFAVSFTHLCKSLPDLIMSLFGGHTKFYIFLMALSIILRCVSKNLRGSEQFRETANYKKYDSIIKKILKVLEFTVFVWCAIDFLSALISFITGIGAYSYFSSMF